MLWNHCNPAPLHYLFTNTLSKEPLHPPWLFLSEWQQTGKAARFIPLQDAAPFNNQLFIWSLPDKASYGTFKDPSTTCRNGEMAPSWNLFQTRYFFNENLTSTLQHVQCYNIVKADRPHPHNYPHLPTGYRHTDLRLAMVQGSECLIPAVPNTPLCPLNI